MVRTHRAPDVHSAPCTRRARPMSVADVSQPMSTQALVRLPVAGHVAPCSRPRLGSSCLWATAQHVRSVVGEGPHAHPAPRPATARCCLWVLIGIHR